MTPSWGRIFFRHKTCSFGDRTLYYFLLANNALRLHFPPAFLLCRNRPRVKWRALDLSRARNHAHRIRINRTKLNFLVPRNGERYAPLCPRACFERQTIRNDARLTSTRLRDVRSREPNSQISNGNINTSMRCFLKTLCKFANCAISHPCCN